MNISLKILRTASDPLSPDAGGDGGALRVTGCARPCPTRAEIRRYAWAALMMLGAGVSEATANSCPTELGALAVDVAWCCTNSGQGSTLKARVAKWLREGRPGGRTLSDIQDSYRNCQSHDTGSPAYDRSKRCSWDQIAEAAASLPECR